MYYYGAGRLIALTVIASFIYLPLAARAMTVPELWAMVERGIKASEYSESEAKDLMRFMRPELEKYYAKKGGVIAPYMPVFPVAGRGLADAYRKGYYAKCYDFYTATNCDDHPAIDIFIKDKKRQSIDDKYKKPADVLSMSPGIVLTVVEGWAPGNALRGGNIVWVYDPVTKGLFYYAHLAAVTVKTGDIVVPGNKLGTVGRTGVLAFERRSQTHLHLMYVKYGQDGTMTPQNVLPLLVQSKRKARMIMPVQE